MATKITILNASPDFLPVPEDKRIEVDPFLKGARQIVHLLDAFGTAFKPVKTDIQGNIDNLQKKIDKADGKLQTFNDMLEKEIAEKATKSKGSAAIAMLWLKRALEFLSAFIECLVEDDKSGKKTENMVALVKKAYESVLKPYHGWFTQKLFRVIMHAVPWRKDFLKSLAGKEGSEDEVIAKLAEFNVLLLPNIAVLTDFLKENQIDYNDSV